MIKSLKIKNKGLSLTKLLSVMAFLGFVILTLAVQLNIIRMNARDEVRAGAVAAIKQALIMYAKSSATGYPLSGGECLKAESGPGRELIDSKVMLMLPEDPLWTTAKPDDVSGGLAVNQAKNFCYYYYSDASDSFRLSYFLESNSKAGRAGINTATQ